MAFEVTIDDRGVVAAFTKAPALIGAAMHRAVELGSADFEGSVIALTPVGATGQLRASITHDVSGSGIMVTGRTYSTDVPIKTASVETGRAPGRMPPSAPLELWVSRKLGITDPSVVYLIRRAIGRRGTKGAHMFQKGFQSQLGRVNARVAELMATVRRVL
jgi:hypothetical protein